MQRILDVKRDQKRRGRHLGGRRPFGFRIEADGSLTEHEGEQAAIRKAQCGGAGSGARRRVEDSRHPERAGLISGCERCEGEGRVMARG